MKPCDYPGCDKRSIFKALDGRVNLCLDHGSLAEFIDIYMAKKGEWARDRAQKKWQRKQNEELC